MIERAWVDRIVATVQEKEEESVMAPRRVQTIYDDMAMSSGEQPGTAEHDDSLEQEMEGGSDLESTPGVRDVRKSLGLEPLG